MAIPLQGDSVFESLQTADPSEQARRDAEASRRMQAQHERAQQRTRELFDANATLPTTLSQITVLNANHTRWSLLARIFNPLLSINQNGPSTLSEAVAAVGQGVDKLNKLDIFETPISLYFDRPPPTSPTATPTDIAAYLSVREKSRVLLNLGTWVGDNDGSLTSSLHLRNILGGAESLVASASRGARTRSAYAASLQAPVLGDPDLTWEAGAQASATSKSWSSHEEVLRGGRTGLRWDAPGGHRHEVRYEGVWRQVTGLGEKASATVRGDAGDSFKSSVGYTFTADRRDNPLLATSGYLAKAAAELAGVGPLRGDVAFGKLELDTQAAAPVPIPFTKRDPGVSLTLGLRGGLLYPLALRGQARPVQSRINDRFTLGGPTDVRGFRLGGLGPRDGGDAVGGDVYAAGGATLLFPFPRVGKDAPLRLQMFANVGRLLGLRDLRVPEEKGRDGEERMEGKDVGRSVGAALRELGDGWPSTSVGVGVVYAMSIARFELNFGVPLVLRRGEEARKGLMLGVGMSFL